VVGRRAPYLGMSPAMAFTAVVVERWGLAGPGDAE